MICSLALLLGAAPSQARTWTVMQDGSGDFMDIQSAVDACAVGDSVLVGPGRYQGYHTWQPGDGAPTFDVIVGVDVDSLTIIGVDRETVIIGPDVLNADTTAKIGFGTALATTWTVFRNLTLENIRDRGIHLYPAGRVTDCVFRNIDSGILAERGRNILIEHCEFFSSICDITTYGPEPEYKATIRNCDFTLGGGGVHVTGHPNVEITHCNFIDYLNPIYIGGGSTARIDSCTMTGGWYGLWIVDLFLNTVDVRNCTFSGQQYNAIVLNNATLTGTGNIIQCNGDYTIDASNCAASFHGNHILKSRLGTVYFNFYNVPHEVMDLTNNWWGTSDPDSIAAWIRDGVDDPQFPIVQYEPFALQPVGEEKKSMGGLKAMFR